jgi:uncharacterized protein YidB (DUF937 family)
MEARLLNGQPLPSWMRFDAQRGVLSGQPPAGMNASIKVEVIIRDSQGNRASSVLDVKVGKNVNDNNSKPQSHWQPNLPQHLGDSASDDALAALLDALQQLAGTAEETDSTLAQESHHGPS